MTPKSQNTQSLPDELLVYRRATKPRPPQTCPRRLMAAVGLDIYLPSTGCLAAVFQHRDHRKTAPKPLANPFVILCLLAPVSMPCTGLETSITLYRSHSYPRTAQAFPPAAGCYLRRCPLDCGLRGSNVRTE